MSKKQLSITTSFTEGLEQQRHLLIDARIVEDAQNAELTLGTVKKYSGNPLFGEDKPWEKRFDNLYANIIYDESSIYTSAGTALLSCPIRPWE